MTTFIRAFLGLFIILLPQLVNAQSHSLKLNLASGYDSYLSDIWVGKLAPAYSYQGKKGMVHQLEWTSFSFLLDRGTDVNDRLILGGGGDLNLIDLGWRYQYSIPLTKKDVKIIPYIGASAGLQFFQRDHILFFQNTWQSRLRKSTATFSLVPALRFKMNQRIFIDAEIPLDLFEFQKTKAFQREPDRFTFSDNDGQFQARTVIIERIQIRMGLGVNLNKE